MATPKDGGPAFPSQKLDGIMEPFQAVPGDRQQLLVFDGMSLRDWFAGQALAGIIAAYSGPESSLPGSGFAASQAYRYADEMLVERIKVAAASAK